MFNIPTIKKGFARHKDESLYPEIWDKIHGLWVPALGPMPQVATTGLDTSLKDWSGNKYHLFAGRGAVNASSEYGNVARFDGQVSDLYFGSGKNMPVGNFERTEAFSIFMLLRCFDGSPNYLVPMSKMDNASPFNGWAVYFFDDSGNSKLVFILQNSATNRIYINCDTIMNSLTDFYSVVITYDGSSSDTGINFYVNGFLSSKSVVESNLTGSILTTSDFNISSREGQNLYWDGDIAIAALWERELTIHDVLALNKDSYCMLRKKYKMSSIPISVSSIYSQYYYQKFLSGT